MPQVHHATARLLAQNGIEVIVPGRQGCCGALHRHGGDADFARRLARQVIARFEPIAAEWIVTNSAGCGAHLKEYGELLSGDPRWADRAAAFSARVRDACELLAECPLVGIRSVLPVRAVYDDPCHLLHAQQIGRAPRTLLAQIAGLELVDLPGAERCCGAAGIYNLLQPEMADRLLEEKLIAIEATGAELVVTANPGCLFQLESGFRRRGSRVRVVHLMELLHGCEPRSASQLWE